MKWYLKQLLPLTYRSHYTHFNYGVEEKHFCVWNMWFGKCYNVEDYIIKVD